MEIKYWFDSYDWLLYWVRPITRGEPGEGESEKSVTSAVALADAMF